MLMGFSAVCTPPFYEPEPEPQPTASRLGSASVRRESRSYLVYLTLNDFERRLDPERFIRVHRAHIVNLDFVKQLVPFDSSRMQIEMRDGTKILASRTRSKELRQLAI